MDLREQLARSITRAEGVNPDAEGYGLGVLMPAGERYPLWKARLHVVDALLEEFQVQDKETVSSTIRTGSYDAS